MGLQSWQGDQSSEPGPLLETLADDVLHDSFLRRSISTFLQTLHDLGPAVDQELQVCPMVITTTII
jgi:hypothetical protein